MSEEYADLLVSSTFWGMMTVSGAFGFLIGLAVYIQIQATSPLSHNVSATAKSAFQSILGSGSFACLGVLRAHLRTLLLPSLPSRSLPSHRLAPLTSLAPYHPVFVFGNTTTAMQMLGLICVLGGSYAYAVVKRGERAAAKAASAGSTVAAAGTGQRDSQRDEEMQPLKQSTQV